MWQRMNEENQDMNVRDAFCAKMHALLDEHAAAQAQCIADLDNRLSAQLATILNAIGFLNSNPPPARNTSLAEESPPCNMQHGENTPSD